MAAPTKNQNSLYDQEMRGTSLFSALLVLDFDVKAVEISEGISVTAAKIFSLPKRAGEYALYHLFTCIDKEKSTKLFRDCWPLHDKKRESQFYRVAFDWYKSLVNENSYLASTKQKPAVSRAEVTPSSPKFFNTLHFLTKSALTTRLSSRGALLMQCPRYSAELHSRNTTAAEVLLVNILQQHDEFVKQQRASHAVTAEFARMARKLVSQYRESVASCQQLRQKLQSAAEAAPGLCTATVSSMPLHRLFEDVSSRLKALDSAVEVSWQRAGSLRSIHEQSCAILQPLVHATASLSHINATNLRPCLPQSATAALTASGHTLPRVFGGESGNTLDLCALLATAELSFKMLDTALQQQQRVQLLRKVKPSQTSDTSSSTDCSNSSVTEGPEVSMWQRRVASMSTCTGEICAEVCALLQDLKLSVAHLTARRLAAVSKVANSPCPVKIWSPCRGLSLSSMPSDPPTPTIYSPIAPPPSTLKAIVLRRCLSPFSPAHMSITASAERTPEQLTVVPSVPVLESNPGLPCRLLDVAPRLSRQHKKLSAIQVTSTGQCRRPSYKNISSRLPAAALASSHKKRTVQKNPSSTSKNIKENDRNYTNVIVCNARNKLFDVDKQMSPVASLSTPICGTKLVSRLCGKSSQRLKSNKENSVACHTTVLCSPAARQFACSRVALNDFTEEGGGKLQNIIESNAIEGVLKVSSAEDNHLSKCASNILNEDSNQFNNVEGRSNLLGLINSKLDYQCTPKSMSLVDGFRTPARESQEKRDTPKNYLRGSPTADAVNITLSSLSDSYSDKTALDDSAEMTKMDLLTVNPFLEEENDLGKMDPLVAHWIRTPTPDCEDIGSRVKRKSKEQNDILDGVRKRLSGESSEQHSLSPNRDTLAAKLRLQCRSNLNSLLLASPSSMLSVPEDDVVVVGSFHDIDFKSLLGSSHNASNTEQRNKSWLRDSFREETASLVAKILGDDSVDCVEKTRLSCANKGKLLPCIEELLSETVDATELLKETDVSLREVRSGTIAERQTPISHFATFTDLSPASHMNDNIKNLPDEVSSLELLIPTLTGEQFIDGSLFCDSSKLLPSKSLFTNLTESILAGESDAALLQDQSTVDIVARESVTGRASLEERRRSLVSRSSIDLTGCHGSAETRSRRLSERFGLYQAKQSDVGIMDVSDSILLNTSLET